MSRFPTAGHLVSWARFAPGVKESAGKRKGKGSTGHGNRYLARVLGEAAVAAGKTNTFLGERYRRIARRRGKKKAIVAIGRSTLVIIWHLLSDPEARFTDLGPDFYDQRINPERKKARPHPPTRNPRLQGHPRARGLTHTGSPSRPAPPRSRRAGGPVRPSPTDFSDQLQYVSSGVRSNQSRQRRFHSARLLRRPP